MRNKLIVLIAAAALLVAGAAQSSVFDPEDSFLGVLVGGLAGTPINGDVTKTGTTLSGGSGAEVVTLEAALFDTEANDPGTALFTGTPLITNLFLTVQNQVGTFDHSHPGGLFQGNGWGVGSLGGSSAIIGRSIIEILGGAITAPIPLSVVGVGGQATAVIGALTATVFVDGAVWATGSVKITGIATNVISIINNAGGRIGATGVGFTLHPSVDENNIVLTENGVTMVTISGTTNFSNTSDPDGVNQVTLISPVYIDASSLTGNPPIPGAGKITLRFVPEPGTILLLGAAVAGLLAVGRKRMKR